MPQDPRSGGPRLVQHGLMKQARMKLPDIGAQHAAMIEAATQFFLLAAERDHLRSDTQVLVVKLTFPGLGVVMLGGVQGIEPAVVTVAAVHPLLLDPAAKVFARLQGFAVDADTLFRTESLHGAGEGEIETSAGYAAVPPRGPLARCGLVEDLDAAPGACQNLGGGKTAVARADNGDVALCIGPRRILRRRFQG